MENKMEYNIKLLIKAKDEKEYRQATSDEFRMILGAKRNEI